MNMAHLLRKYTSNRGSALFMVISTMTALFISCMAMYFSMVSARSSQYVVFNQMQANQSAMSISRIVGSALSDIDSDLYKAAMKLKPGESITTGSNGFKSLDPNVATGLDEIQLGAYSVTITCTGLDGDGNPIVDVMVITSVDGKRESIHMPVRLGLSTSGGGGDDGAGGDAELFAATGYVPNDAYIYSGYFLTDVFYDTQYTYINTFSGGGGENRIGQGISTGGSLLFNEGAMSVIHSPGSFTEAAKQIGPVTWAIRGDFYPNFSSDFRVRGGSKFLVGGDFIREGSESLFVIDKNDDNNNYTGIEALEDHIFIYVNGDFNYSGNYIKDNTWVFVNGNVSGISALNTNSRLYVTGTDEERAAKISALPGGVQSQVRSWPKNGTFADGLTYDEAMELLGQKTQTIAYYKWDLSKETEGAEHIDIRLNATEGDWTDDKNVTYKNGESTYIISYDENTSSANLLKSKGGLYPGVIGSAFVIDSVWTHGGNNVGQTIIIDTGDDPDNIITIQVSDVLGTGVFSWFADEEETWWPEYSKEFRTPNGQINNHTRLVLIKGRGTVLIDVPAGVTYQDAGYQQTIHASWYLAEGGKIKTRNVNGTNYLDFDLKADEARGAEVIKYVHRQCVPGDGCNFDRTKSGDSWVYPEADATCRECGGKLSLVTCSVHGDVNKFCDSCHHEKNGRDNWCVNHVDRTAFENFYKTLSGMDKEFATGVDGKVVYPTTNFMVVSCEESAEMLFSKMKDGTSIASNSFFGFVYAPYMSFLASGGSIGGFVKICGGMTVADYDFNSTHGYIGCYPDKMPNEIAGMEGGGSMAGGKLKGTSKNWKIEIGGYY